MYSLWGLEDLKHGLSETSSACMMHVSVHSVITYTEIFHMTMVTSCAPRIMTQLEQMSLLTSVQITIGMDHPPCSKWNFSCSWPYWSRMLINMLWWTISVLIKLLFWLFVSIKCPVWNLFNHWLNRVYKGWSVRCTVLWVYIHFIVSL